MAGSRIDEALSGAGTMQNLVVALRNAVKQCGGTERWFGDLASGNDQERELLLEIGATIVDAYARQEGWVKDVLIKSGYSLEQLIKDGQYNDVDWDIVSQVEDLVIGGQGIKNLSITVLDQMRVPGIWNTTKAVEAFARMGYRPVTPVEFLALGVEGEPYFGRTFTVTDRFAWYIESGPKYHFLRQVALGEPLEQLLANFPPAGGRHYFAVVRDLNLLKSRAKTEAQAVS